MMRLVIGVPDSEKIRFSKAASKKSGSIPINSILGEWRNLVDARDLGSRLERGRGSSPLLPI